MSLIEPPKKGGVSGLLCEMADSSILESTEMIYIEEYFSGGHQVICKGVSRCAFLLSLRGHINNLKMGC